MKSFLRTTAIALTLAFCPLHAADLTPQEVAQVLAVPPFPRDLDKIPPPLPPNPEHEPYLKACGMMAVKGKSPEMIQLLLAYQLAHLSFENPFPAKVMGRVYVGVPELFTSVYNAMPAAARIGLGPYLKYGYGEATQNDRGTRVAYERDRKFNRLMASLMNARARDDVPVESQGRPVTATPSPKVNEENGEQVLPATPVAK